MEVCLTLFERNGTLGDMYLQTVENGAKKRAQPKENRVFVLEEQGKFRYSSRPKPTVESRYVLVKVLVTGLCGSDVSRRCQVFPGDKLIVPLSDPLLETWAHRQLCRR